VAAYSAVGLALVGSRVIGLGHSFWTDEIIAVEDFVRRGPGTILSGPDLSHELYGLLAWATAELVGESEVALRLWSVLPFLAGAAVVTVWLHKRSGALAGILFLFLATASPLLLDITRQARGYGLAFLAMAVMVVAALESLRTPSIPLVAAFCAGGLVATMTLPQAGIAFIAMGLVLAAGPPPRKPVLVGVGASLVALFAFYAAHLGQVRDAAQIEDGVRIETLWLATAPIDQVLLPALVWIDGTALVAGLVWLPLILLAVAVMAASPLVRDRQSALLLLGPVVATVVVLWLAQAYVIPRYLSYLLVPLFVLLATGMSELVAGWRSRRALTIAVVAGVVVVLLAGRFATLAPDVVRLPREANRDAARAIEAHEPPRLPVLVHMRNPRNLAHYLGRPPAELAPDEAADRICTSSGAVVYVTQPFGIATVEVPCLARDGVRHVRLEQYARGGRIDVWVVPPG
jgi:hypothetical protein